MSAPVPTTDEASALPSSPTEPTPEYVNYSTPIPTPTPEARPTFTRPPDDMNSQVNYSLIYDESKEYKGEVVSFDYDLLYPPMIISFEATTVSLTDTKAGTSQFGSKGDYSVTTTNPNPAAFYRVSVYDDCTGELIKEDGVVKFARLTQKDEMKILETGKLHIELYGNLATVNTKIKVAPENLNGNNMTCG